MSNSYFKTHSYERWGIVFNVFPLFTRYFQYLKSHESKRVLSHAPVAMLQHEILPVVQHFSYQDICRETNIKRRVTKSNGNIVCSLQCIVFGTVLPFSCSFPSRDFRLISDKQTTSVIVSKSRWRTFEYAIEYGLVFYHGKTWSSIMSLFWACQYENVMSKRNIYGIHNEKILQHDFSHPTLSTSGSCRGATLTRDTELRVENIQLSV